MIQTFSILFSLLESTFLHALLQPRLSLASEIKLLAFSSLLSYHSKKAPQLDTYKKNVQLTRLEALQRVWTCSLSGGGLSMAGEISKLGKGPGQ